MCQAENGVILVSDELHLSFNGIKALDGISCQIETGQIVSIIGPNGAGKTCLINCITGYYCPQKGKILFKGQNILGLRPHQIARLGISRTFQNPTTYPNMTALDILMAAQYIHTRATILDAMLYFGRSRREELKSRQIVEEIIAFSHIQDLRKKQ